MTGAVLELDQLDLQRFQRVLDRLIDARPRDLLEQLSGGVESQTRERIGQTKRGPDGQPWEAWSPDYAKTRHSGQSLLQGEGDMLDSIDRNVDDDSAEVGSNLIYFATHQYGDKKRGIPARAPLGLSADNLAALGQLTENWAEALLQ